MEKPTYAETLSLRGDYYEGYVDYLQSVLCKHSSSTLTTYGVRRSHCSSKPSASPTEESTVLPKLYWSKQEGSRIVHFDDAPFTVHKCSILDCQYGNRYWKKERNEKCDKSSSRLRLQGSRKVGCHAYITIHEYILYPEFRCQVTDLTPYKLRQEKKKLLEAARMAIKNQTAIMTYRYFVSLPTLTAHSGHSVSVSACFCQRVHPTIIKKTYELVSTGMTETKEVQKALGHYVKHDIPTELGITPLLTDRAFYPMPRDVKNHIGNAKSLLELSKLDQENLHLKIEGWKKLSTSTHYFRPYIRLADNEIPHENSQFTHIPGNYVGKSGCDDEWVKYYGINKGLCKQSFLWVHQDKWQAELLVKYGNTITLIDATYKTTKYDLALFFLCVRTNVNYTVVAEFIVQSESAEQIAEALAIVKSWNSEWYPPIFMTDYSEAEQLAINQVFPNSNVYLCDFHREQAWERWVKNRKNGLGADEASQLLQLLRACAHATPPNIDQDLPMDHNYQVAVAELQKSSIWTSNHLVQNWLNSKWLSIPQKWARAYRDGTYHAAVDTNNGIEAQNKVLKYRFLPRKSVSLSNIVTILVDHFLPEQQRNYLFLNSQMDPTYRPYSTKVPSYLHGRPKNIILHCLVREEKARKTLSECDILKVDDENGLFSVKGRSGTSHGVDFGKESGTPSCTCQDWIRYRVPCKHFFLIFITHIKWSWNSLPSTYLREPHLSCDNKALENFSGESSEPIASMTNITPEPCHQKFTEPLPTKVPSANVLQQKIRISLKRLESLSYNIVEAEKLMKILKSTEELEKLAQDMIPTEAGLIVRPQNMTSITARKISLKYKKQKYFKHTQNFSSLPKPRKCGRPKAKRLRTKNKQSRPMKSTTAPASDMATPAPAPHLSTTPPAPDISTTTGKKRARRCGGCANCKMTDCGACIYCLDKKKYGGPGRKKKCCEKRQCMNISKSEPNTDKQKMCHTSKNHSVHNKDVYDQVEDFLSAIGRTRHTVIGDGNCLYRALAKALTGEEEKHSNIRLLLQRFENLNKDLFKEVLTGANKFTIDEHVQNMGLPGTWGTHVEIFAIANYLRVSVYTCTVSNTGSQPSIRWEVFKPLWPLSKLCFPVPISDDPCDLQSLTHIELLYFQNLHYDCILSSQTSTPNEELPTISPSVSSVVDLDQ